MSSAGALPTHDEHRAFMHHLKAFRDSLSDREQRMLDAVVLAAYWPGGRSGEDVQGYRLLPYDAIWGTDESVRLPIDNTTWAATLLTLPFYP